MLYIIYCANLLRVMYIFKSFSLKSDSVPRILHLKVKTRVQNPSISRLFTRRGRLMETERRRRVAARRAVSSRDKGGK